MSILMEKAREKFRRNFKPVGLSQWEKLIREYPELLVIKQRCFTQWPYACLDHFVLTLRVGDKSRGFAVAMRAIYFNPDSIIAFGAQVSRADLPALWNWQPVIWHQLFKETYLVDEERNKKAQDRGLISQPWIIFKDGGCRPLDLDPRQEAEEIDLEGQSLQLLQRELNWGRGDDENGHTLVIVTALLSGKPDGVGFRGRSLVDIRLIKPPAQ